MRKTKKPTTREAFGQQMSAASGMTDRWRRSRPAALSPQSVSNPSTWMNAPPGLTSIPVVKKQKTDGNESMYSPIALAPKGMTRVQHPDHSSFEQEQWELRRAATGVHAQGEESEDEPETELALSNEIQRLQDHHFMTTGGAASNGYANAWRTWKEACANRMIDRDPHIFSSDTFRLVASWILVHRNWQSLDTMQSALNHYFDVELDQSTSPFNTKRILSLKKAYRRRRFEKDKAAGTPQAKQRVYLAPRGVQLLVRDGQRLGAMSKQGRLSAAGSTRLSEIGAQLLALLGLWRASSLSHQKGDVQLEFRPSAARLIHPPTSASSSATPIGAPVAPVGIPTQSPVPATRRSERVPTNPLRFSSDHSRASEWREAASGEPISPTVPAASPITTMKSDGVAPVGSHGPITKICLTGGPCSGKSAALSMLKPRLQAAGFNCLFAKEGATRILDGCGGYDPAWAGKPEHVAMQCAFYDAQIQEEGLMLRMAALRPGPTVIVFDRGVLDGIAFCSEQQWAEVLTHGRTSQHAILQRYDLVADMQTLAAFQGGRAYEWGPDCASNKDRFHDPVQARAAAAEITTAYRAHPQYHAVPATADFDVKIDSLFDIIMAAAPLTPGRAWTAAQPHTVGDDTNPVIDTAIGFAGLRVPAATNADPALTVTNSSKPSNIIYAPHEFGSFSDLQHTTRFIKGWEAHDRRLPYTKTIPPGPADEPDHARNVVFSVIHAALEVGHMESCLRTGQGMEALDLSKIMLNTIDKSELDSLGARGMKVTSHSWRKTGASAMRARGVAFQIIQEEGLWSDIKYAKLYADPRYPKDSFMSELFDWLPRERLA